MPTVLARIAEQDITKRNGLALGVFFTPGFCVVGWLLYGWLGLLVFVALAASLISLIATLLKSKEQLRLALVHLKSLQSEIEALRLNASELKVQAHHDGLTGLANRLLLSDRFRLAVERAKRSHKSFALMMVDLNDFKSVNDNFGHAAGDAVLIAMSRRLLGAVRASDTVARLGGDEFILLIESVDASEELMSIGEKMIESLAAPIALEAGVVINRSASLGLALYPRDGVDMNDLLYVADRAMYECKSTGLMSLY
jgi:diguanylate cyclase (GGDEF)-like protein